jgi:hypothetical protein
LMRLKIVAANTANTTGSHGIGSATAVICSISDHLVAA